MTREIRIEKSADTGHLLISLHDQHPNGEPIGCGFVMTENNTALNTFMTGLAMGGAVLDEAMRGPNAGFWSVSQDAMKEEIARNV